MEMQPPGTSRFEYCHWNLASERIGKDATSGGGRIMDATRAVQEKFKIEKIRGEENAADIGTKAVGRQAAQYYMTKMGFEEVDGNK